MVYTETAGSAARRVTIYKVKTETPGSRAVTLSRSQSRDAPGPQAALPAWGLVFCRPPGLVRLQPVPGIHTVRVWLPCPGRSIGGEAVHGEVWRGPCRERARLPLRGVPSVARAEGGLQMMSEDRGAQARPSRQGRGAGGATGTSPCRLSDGDRLRPPVIVGPDSRALLRLGLPHQQPMNPTSEKSVPKSGQCPRSVVHLF